MTATMLPTTPLAITSMEFRGIGLQVGHEGLQAWGIKSYSNFFLLFLYVEGARPQSLTKQQKHFNGYNSMTDVHQVPDNPR